MILIGHIWFDVWWMPAEWTNWTGWIEWNEWVVNVVVKIQCDSIWFAHTPILLFNYKTTYVLQYLFRWCVCVCVFASMDAYVQCSLILALHLRNSKNKCCVALYAYYMNISKLSNCTKAELLFTQYFRLIFDNKSCKSQFRYSFEIYRIDIWIKFDIFNCIHKVQP